VKQALREISLLTGALIVLAGPMTAARAQTVVTTEMMINQLSGQDTPPDIDVAALRQQALDRAKSKADPVPLKRPPVATALLKLPQFIVDVQFDPDSPIIRPESYSVIGRIADALSHPALLPYRFLIVGHVESTGKRDYNLILSQRRADAIREVLATTFKVSSKRLQAIGLGEEQLQDAVHPTAPVNQQIRVVTVGNAP
jgi:outer membrane protein OmpA-like peptidoglycan-associated protein